MLVWICCRADDEDEEDYGLPRRAGKMYRALRELKPKKCGPIQDGAVSLEYEVRGEYDTFYGSDQLNLKLAGRVLAETHFGEDVHVNYVHVILLSDEVRVRVNGWSIRERAKYELRRDPEFRATCASE